LAKRALFTNSKKGGIRTPVLSKKKGESDADAFDRLSDIGWNINKFSYKHVVDGNNVIEIHAGKRQECPICLKRENKTKVKPKTKEDATNGDTKKNKKKTKKTTKSNA
jgi:hypothetical protein